MPRARKPRQDAPSADDEEQQRPSQLNQIREALASPPKALPDDEAPAELPAPEEAPELPAPTAEEAAEPPTVMPENGESLDAAPEASSEPEPAAAAQAEPQAQAAAVAPWVPPPTTPPPGTGPAAGVRSGAGGGSSLAIGIVLIVVGGFFLLIRLLEIDLSSYGWPLYVIIPGLTLLVVGFISLGSGALIPGGIITVIGLVLAYQSVADDWASWAYAWALVAPGGVGLGIFLQGLRVHDQHLTRQGRSLMYWAVLIFLIGFVFFESILNISGHDYGKIGQAALPALLIIIGVTLLVRNFQRSSKS